MTDGRFDRFRVVLQINCQGTGMMADGWVDRLEKVLCVPKEECRSLMVNGVWINKSYSMRFEIDNSDLRGYSHNKTMNFMRKFVVFEGH
jgi:hypothetical protein